MSVVETPTAAISHALVQFLFAAPAPIGDAAVSQGESLVGAAQAGGDETRQAITFLIICLIAIAVGLAALTIWYWQFTSPRRQARTLLDDLGHFDPSTPELPALESGIPNDRALENHAAAGRVPEPGAHNLAADDKPASEALFAPAANPPPAAPRVADRLVGRSAPFECVRRDEPVRPVPVDAPGSSRIDVARQSEVPKPLMPAATTPREPVRSTAPITVPVASVPKPLVPPPARPVQPSVSNHAIASPASPATPSRPVAPLPPPSSVVSRDRTDEVAIPRHRRTEQTKQTKQTERAEQIEESQGLSDDDWAAVMQSAFSQLKK